MPYRGALDTTLARCTQLQERARELEHALGLPWRPPLEITTHDVAALARTERILETRLADLEEERAARHIVNGLVVAQTSAPPARTSPSWKAIVVATAAAFALFAVVVFAVRFFAGDANVAASVYRAAGHTREWNEHCAVTVTRVRDACDVDVACVTMTRHAHDERCVERDGALRSHIEGAIDVDTDKSTVSLLDDHGETFVIELDPWKR